MPHAQSEGARIYYEETGNGTPILFIHEFGGDYRSWDDQMRHFGRELALHPLGCAGLSAVRRAARTRSCTGRTSSTATRSPCWMRPASRRRTSSA